MVRDKLISSLHLDARPDLWPDAPASHQQKRLPIPAEQDSHAHEGKAFRFEASVSPVVILEILAQKCPGIGYEDLLLTASPFARAISASVKRGVARRRERLAKAREQDHPLYEIRIEDLFEWQTGREAAASLSTGFARTDFGGLVIDRPGAAPRGLTQEERQRLGTRADELDASR